MSSRFTARQQDAAAVDPVRAWRRERLVAAGFEPEDARRIAADARHDLHALLELVDRGCPPALAERILAPLDDGAPVR